MKTFFASIFVLFATVFFTHGAGSFPIKNGVLQNSLDANGQTIFNATDLVDTNGNSLLGKGGSATNAFKSQTSTAALTIVTNGTDFTYTFAVNTALQALSLLSPSGTANLADFAKLSTNAFQTFSANLTDFSKLSTNAFDTANSALNAARNATNGYPWGPLYAAKTNGMVNLTQKTGLNGSAATNTAPDFIGEIGTSDFGDNATYPWMSYGLNPGQWSQTFSFDFSRPAQWGGLNRMPTNRDSGTWKYWVNGNIVDQTSTNLNLLSDSVMYFYNANLYKYSQVNFGGLVTNSASGGSQVDPSNVMGVGVGNQSAIEAFAGAAFIVVFQQPLAISQTARVGTNGIIDEPSTNLDRLPDHQVTVWDFQNHKIHYGHLTNGVYSFTNAGWIDAAVMDYQKDTFTVRSNVGAQAIYGTNCVFSGGIPVATTNQLLDATTLGANGHIKTGPTTNLISSEDASGYTNIVAYTHEGTTTNITITFNGTPQTLTATNGPTQYYHFAGANGSACIQIPTNVAIHFDYNLTGWLAGTSNNAVTNGTLIITSFGGTNDFQMQEAIVEK